MLVRVLCAVIAVLVLWIGYTALAQGHAYRALVKENEGFAYGAPADKARLTIVEFVNYTSPIAKNANADVMQLADDHPGLRIVFIPLAVRSEFSARAARYAAAAAQQHKFIKLHEELMRTDRPLTDDIIADLATREGLDAAQLKKDATANDQLRQQSVRNARLAVKTLHIRQLPSFLVGRKILYVPTSADRVAPDLTAFIRQAGLK